MKKLNSMDSEILEEMLKDHGTSMEEVIEFAKTGKGDPASDEFKKVATEIYKILHSLAAAIIEGGQEHAPMLLNFTYPMGKMMSCKMVSIRGDDHGRSKDFVAFLQRGFAAAGLVSVFLCESWMKEYGPEEEVPISLTDAKDKREGMQFNFRYKRMQLMAVDEIKSDEGRRTLTPLGKLLDTSGGAMTGRMADRPTIQ